jgi:hypothetical protein
LICISKWSSNMRKSTLLTASAALTLALATALPSAGFAAPHGGGGGGGHFGGGHFAGGRVGGGAAFARPMAGAAPAGRTWNGGGTAWNGGGWHRNGWWPGAVAAGLAAGGAYAYYGGPYYDDSYAYYDGDYGPDYYDSGVAVPAAPVGGDASYCAQRYRSYDPASGTYLGYDGLRHPCP